MPSQAPGIPAGVARFGLELSRRLVARGTHDYMFRSAWSAQQLPPEIANGSQLVTIPRVTSYLREVVTSTMHAPRAFPAREIDAVVNIDPLGLAAGGRRRLTIVHDLYYRALPALYSRFARLKAEAIHGAVLRRSHAIVAISETTAGDVRRFFPTVADRVRAIYSASTMPATVPGSLPAEVSGAEYVLAVANVTSNKNFAVLADAFGRLAREFPLMKLVHVGNDESDLIARGLAEHGAGDRLVRLRHIDDATLAAVYGGALCLCVPSLYEGFCLPIVEAQNFDCPVVFSNRSASGEVGGSGGIPFDPEDAGSLTAILRRVAGDAALRQEMRAAGSRNLERFSWDRAVGEYENAISAIL